MTFAEKARKEHPELCDGLLGYPTHCCPHHDSFGYEEFQGTSRCTKLSCRECWNREIPEETVEKPVEEAKPTTTKKTKAELLKEIDSLKEEVARLERYSKYEECAGELHAMYEAFKAQGFTDNQAFKLVGSITCAALNANKP